MMDAHQSKITSIGKIIFDILFPFIDDLCVHYIDVIMTTVASQITSITVVYSIVYSGADQRKYQSSASLALGGELTGTGDFPTQKVSNAENVSIWWRHHVDPRIGYTLLKDS